MIVGAHSVSRPKSNKFETVTFEMLCRVTLNKLCFDIKKKKNLYAACFIFKKTPLKPNKETCHVFVDKGPVSARLTTG